MKMIDASARRGTGTAVTLTRKNSGVDHNPLPRTERGKRRAARKAADRVLAMNGMVMPTELGVTK